MKVWNPHVLCDGVPAGHRASWCMDNMGRWVRFEAVVYRGCSSHDARGRVLEEYPLKPSPQAFS